MRLAGHNKPTRVYTSDVVCIAFTIIIAKYSAVLRDAMDRISIPLFVAFAVLLVSLRVRPTVSLELEEIRYPPLNESDGRTPLYFGLIQSLVDGQYVSGPSMPGLELALDLINADETLLPGYSLHYVLTDAQVS